MVGCNCAFPECGTHHVAVQSSEIGIFRIPQRKSEDYVHWTTATGYYEEVLGSGWRRSTGFWMAKKYWVLDGEEVLGSGWRRSTGFWMAKKYWVLDGEEVLGSGWRRSTGFWMAKKYWVLDGEFKRQIESGNVFVCERHYEIEDIEYYLFIDIDVYTR